MSEIYTGYLLASDNPEHRSLLPKSDMVSLSLFTKPNLQQVL